MASVPRPHWQLHWRQRTKPAKRDPTAEQLHRDRLTAVIVLSIVAVIVAAMIMLAAMSGWPAGRDPIQPWMMMP